MKFVKMLIIHKKLRIILVGLLLLIAGSPFAHGDEGHKAKQDSVTTDTLIETTTAVVAHPHTDNHLMVTESKIVDASMSDFSNLHPLVVHFPIVLVLLAVLTQIASLFIWKKQMDWATLLLLFGGLLSAYVASVFVHPHTTGLSEAASMVLEKHDQFAYYTLWFSGIGLLFKVISFLLLKDKLWLELTIVLLLASAAFSVSKAGHYGATLAHIHGVGVQGKFIESNDVQHSHEH
ncbi:MAG: DUF2231 domain-containing protein [Lewinella sp.]|uniref:DUF2231 domain-containing protein n=1 Tax=Lewinella sp. TaxID=2004506 RepID=UPI003D6B27F0